MPVVNGIYLKDFPALPSSVADANIIPVAIAGNQIAYRTTVAGIVTDARVTSKLLTGLSVTGTAILATDTILQAFGKVQNQLNGKVTSVGLTMPAAFTVANSPITSAGTLAVTAAGLASQYIRGDGALADFPTTGGGGSSVSYYLNGSVSQGTIGGNVYYEMNKTPVIGAGTNIAYNSNGYIAQFITDANDPASLLIPGGNWNVEMYFSASSSGGTPSFYVEVYKYDGSTFTLLGSSATTPEGITNGTAIDIYYTSVGIPETVLAITDRLAIRVYVTNSGRTITLHTEDNHLSEIVTTFSNGLTSLNGLSKQAQYFAVGSTGTDFNISSSVDTHTFNIPSASASNRGLITTGTQTIAGAKTFNSDLTVNGINVGKGNNSIASNTSIGASALASNTTGLVNTAIGNSALNANTDGNFNTAVGVGSLQSNISGISNSALGYVSLSANISGGQNSAFGNLSLTANTTGSGNTASGYSALSNNISGSNNTAIGYTSGGTLTTGSGNTFIGANVVSGSSSLANNILIGNGTGAVKAQHDGTNWTLTGGTTLTGALSGTSATFDANNAVSPSLVVKNTLAGHSIEVQSQIGSPVFYMTQTGDATFARRFTLVGGETFDMGATMLVTGSSYYNVEASFMRPANANNHNIAFRTGTVSSNILNWRVGNSTGNTDFEITNNNNGSYETSLKINGTTNAVTLLAGLSGTSATLSGKLSFSANSGATASGQFGRDATYGMFQWASTGSTDDWSVFSPSLGYIMHVPTGTVNTVFGGNTTSSSIANILGSDGGGKQLKFIGGVTTYNGLIAVQENYGNTLEITASSAVGTTTFNRNIAKFNLSDLSTTLAGTLTGTSATFSGAVSKGSGSFRIEHPLPSLSKTHQLVHSFIEGPQADLIYRGKLTLSNGKAHANIDEVSTMTEGTFEVLCREVQCFTTNESGWDLVKGKVIGNIIYIESQNEKSIDEISWMVIGERKDKHMIDTEWTDKNGKVIVEPLKPIEPKPMGKYVPIVQNNII